MPRSTNTSFRLMEIAEQISAQIAARDLLSILLSSACTNKTLQLATLKPKEIASGLQFSACQLLQRRYRAPRQCHSSLVSGLLDYQSHLFTHYPHEHLSDTALGVMVEYESKGTKAQEQITSDPAFSVSYSSSQSSIKTVKLFSHPPQLSLHPHYLRTAEG